MRTVDVYVLTNLIALPYSVEHLKAGDSGAESLHGNNFVGNYEGPLYAPHPDLKERRAELGLPTPDSRESNPTFEGIFNLLLSESGCGLELRC